MSARVCQVGALACSIAMLGACADGYPTDDEALVLKHGMSREAALQAMEIIGIRNYLDDRWRYELSKDCRLRIESRTLAGGTTVLTVLGRQVKATVVDKPGPDSHTVFAHAPNQPPTSGTPVLDSANWYDATQMKWLIEYLPAVCANRMGMHK